MSHYDRLVAAIRYANERLYDAIHLCLSACVKKLNLLTRQPLSV